MVFAPFPGRIVAAIDGVRQQLGQVITRPDDMKAGKLADWAAVLGELLEPLTQDALKVGVVHLRRVGDYEHEYSPKEKAPDFSGALGRRGLGDESGGQCAVSASA